MKAYSERTRGVTSGSPASTAVQTHALILDDLEETTATESFRVCLSLDLQDIKREEDNLSDADQTEFRSAFEALHSQSTTVPSSSGVHNGLAISLAESIIEIVAPVLGQEIASEGLSSVLVDTLKDLTTRSSLVTFQSSVPKDRVVPCIQQRTRDQGKGR